MNITDKKKRMNATEEPGQSFVIGVVVDQGTTKQLTIRQECGEEEDDIFLSIPEHVLKGIFRTAKICGFDLGSDAEIIWNRNEEAVLLCLQRRGVDPKEISSFLDRPYSEILAKLALLEAVEEGAASRGEVAF